MRQVSFALIALASLFAPAVFAQTDLTVDVKPVVEGKATPGGEYAFKLNFTVPEGYHAYHKDNPGYSLPIDVKFDELSGLTLKETIWPEPHKHKDDFSEEWELNGSFDLEYIFTVPADASGTLTVSGKHSTQFCDAEGCLQAEGEFSADIPVEQTAAPEPTPDDRNLPQASVTASFNDAVQPGGEGTLSLTIKMTDGYHTYHKDNPGFGLGPTIEFTELSGMTVKSVDWPEPKKHKYDTDWIEWEYENELTLTYTLSVSKDAKGKLPVAFDWNVQVCNDDGCWVRKGANVATLTISAAKPEKNDATNEHGFYLDFDYALELAKKEDKPLLVDFNGRNCIPCRKMEKYVFPNEEVHKALEDFVIVSVQNDIGDKRYNELWEDYKPSPGAAVPYYAVLNHEGEVLRGISATLAGRDQPKDARAPEFAAFLRGEEWEPAEAVSEEKPDENKPAEENSKPENASSKDWPEGLLPGPYGTVNQAFDFSADFSAEAIKPGGEVTLKLTFKMKQNDSGETYYLYHRDTPFGLGLTVDLKGAGVLEPVDDWQYPDYKVHEEEGIGTSWELVADEIVIVQKFKVPENAKEGNYSVYGQVGGQYCDSRGCINFSFDDADSSNRKFGFVADIEVSQSGQASALDSATTTGKGGKGGATSDGEIDNDRSLEGRINEQGGLFFFLLLALGAGMITLLTPCVLPVLPLTVGFFVSQHEKGQSTLLTALIYCLCIIGSFTAFGIITSLTLSATGAQNIATNGYVNIFLALLFFVFALSFLGLFELKVPDFMTRWFTKKQMNAQKSGRGYAKAFFSGSAFALISFSCTGPIAGAFLAGAATGSVWTPALAMLAFSSGMAIPIFVLGQFPVLMKKMPKSGGWMNAMKVVFGFIELGLAIMYISAAEQAFVPPVAEWVDRYVVLAAWIAVSLAAGLYLFGFFRMPHDHEKTEQIGVIRSILAVMFISFALYLTPGLFGAQFGATLEGILPLPPENSGIQLSLGNGESEKNNIKKLDWHDDLETALDVSAKVNKPVFIDFTGDN